MPSPLRESKQVTSQNLILKKRLSVTLDCFKTLCLVPNSFWSILFWLNEKWRIEIFSKEYCQVSAMHMPCTWPSRVSGLYKQHTSTYVIGLRWGKTPSVEPEAYNSLLKRRKRKPKREELLQRVIEVSAKCDCLFQLRVERCTVFRKTKSVNCARFAILDSNQS